jgi:AmmeMemoRadiSam system protein A/AmmeMemoRadiSam system protein B
MEYGVITEAGDIMPVLGAFIVPHPPLIVPEVGKGEERKIIRTIEGYKEIARRIAGLNPDTIIVTSPHSVMYSDYIHVSPGKQASGSFARFSARQVSFKVRYDEDFVKELEKAADKEGINAGTLGERDPSLDHGTMVPLYFINHEMKDYKLVRIGISGLSVAEHYAFGKCITRTADKLGRNIVFVASGDLSHKLKSEGPYGYAPEGVQFDKEITEAMAKGDFYKFMTFNSAFCEAAAECGLRSFIIMAGALDGRKVKPELLSYEGPFGVGYAVSAYEISDNDESRCFDKIYMEEQLSIARERQKGEDEYVRLARYSLETYIKSGKYASLPNDLPSEMTDKRAGVFVSLKKYGELRGCIGTISPVTGSIAKEILRNAVSAGVEDPRFPPVKERELKDLVYSVDVLSPAEPISSPDELDVKRYGVIVSSGRKRGLLLPNLEGVDTVEQQLSIAKRKAGIYDNEKVSLERFEVVRHT